MKFKNVELQKEFTRDKQGPDRQKKMSGNYSYIL
jgi:hypothetical protein